MQGPVWVMLNCGLVRLQEEEEEEEATSPPTASLWDRQSRLLRLLLPTAETTSRLSPPSAQWVWHLSSSLEEVEEAGQRDSTTRWLEPQPAVRLRLSGR